MPSASRIAVLAVGLGAASGCSLLTDLEGLHSLAGPSSDGGAPDDGGDGGGGGVDAGDALATDASDAAPLPYELVYTLDIPTSGDWNVAADVPYTTKPAAGGAPVRRVAYRLVLDAEEVRVEMDTFTPDVSRLGVPVDDVFQQRVTNVVVTSTSPRVTTNTTPTDGNIEFWSNCYNEGPDGDFDANDIRSASEPDCYGSMQIHVGGSPVISFNRWSEGTGRFDIGFGKSGRPGQSDWTFAQTAGAFKKRRLEISVLR